MEKSVLFLDTTNMEAVEDYADLCLNQKEFSESEKYYQICLRIAIRDNEYNCIGSTLYKLGNLYFFLLSIKTSAVNRNNRSVKKNAPRCKHNRLY